ncbi:hypothetical protein J2X20_005782 [Pelomonas saccharophila]|uniref:Ice-binding protein C-terminal domain-containing protein n=1 Tax=Roseateles saccharophilus TaxID=304 RepID=A0ABU1YW76_ROSSA|nr:PEP-CTERM sorting domain-containing protein [Roseateles saccharophilus]MDR7273097.1 hypothetical protein [Roseateles saccharophilus]
MLKLFRLAAAAGLLAASAAQAVVISGVDIPLGQIFAATQTYQNVPLGIGDTLGGYGKIDSINSQAVSSLCSGCELTYVFGGYTVASVSSSEIRFSGGWLKVYAGFGADNDFTTLNAGGSAGDLAEASNGTLLLSLKGHAVDAAGNTFVATGVGIGTTSPTGFSTGLMDVDTAAGGTANTYFNTNGIAAVFGGGAADVQLGSSFTALQPLYPAECPGGGACLRGSSNVIATTAAVPEPETAALLLGGLGVILTIARRRLR